jgi:hypothetical protein
MGPIVRLEGRLPLIIMKKAKSHCCNNNQLKVRHEQRMNVNKKFLCPFKNLKKTGKSWLEL